MTSLDSGQTGCAFYIPGLKISKRFRLDDGVSVFTAELFAIYMALFQVMNMPVTVNAIVIFTDSKSSLDALKGWGKNRESLVFDCRVAIHQLIERGTSVSLMWVPGHVGIAGNEAADVAAREAALLPTVTDAIGYSLSEINSKLKSTSLEGWASDFSEIALENNWFDCNWYAGGVHPNIPKHLVSLFYRLRTQSIRFSYLKLRCACGATLSFQHIFDCGMLSSNFTTHKHYNIQINAKNSFVSTLSTDGRPP